MFEDKISGYYMGTRLYVYEHWALQYNTKNKALFEGKKTIFF